MNQNASEQQGTQAVPAQVVAPDELQLIRAKSAAQFNLTPIGQAVKQFEVQQRMAQMYAISTIIPSSYRENIGNCVIAIDMAMRMQANPLMIMQNLYIVNGNPSFSSKFLIATINASGRFSPLRYEFRGQEGDDSYACRVYSYETSDRDKKEPLYGDWVSLKMAREEGWYNKSGSKWRTMPNQMLRYRAAAFWQRVYCPEISMGFMTSEEYEDMTETSKDYVQEIEAEANKRSIQIPDTKPETAEPANPGNEPVKEETPLAPAGGKPSFMQ
jgi:hypothetical protein